MAKDDRRLGKGLAALLGENLDAPETEAADQEIELDRIRPNPYQPRAGFEDESLDHLAVSIRENGLLQPLIVRPAGDGFEIVAGERRFRALRRLGWSSAPALVRGLSDEEMLVVALVENLQREDLSPLEEARGYRQLIDGFGLTQEDVGRHVGRDRSTISNALRLLTLPDEIQELVANGRISAGHARALLGLEGVDRQVELARRAAEEGWSVRETERRVRKARAPRKNGAKRASPHPAAPSTDPVARQAELMLERALGTQVSVRAGADGAGTILVAFHDPDDFDRLLDLIVGEGAADELR